jgi:hypothetical protein
MVPLGKKARQAAASTPVSLPGPPSSDSFDVLLAQQRPFGDSAYLHEQVQARYHQRLLKIAADLPIAGALSSALERATPYRQYRTLGDPVVRHAVHQVLRHVWHGAGEGRLATEGPSPIHGLSLAGCEEIFRETIGHLEGGGRGGPLESSGPGLRRLGAEVCHGSLWSEEHRDDVFGRSFRGMVHDNFGGAPLCVPTAAESARISLGAELLGILMPHCARSVLSHAHLTVIVPHVGSWKRKGSCSEFQLPGTIFLNREMLANPWWVAEHLLHESLHQKLYDFRHTHSLLAEDLSADWQPGGPGAAAVRAIWNVGGASEANAWDTFRAIAAFHVYVHLAAFSVQVERRRTELARRFGAPPEGTGPAITHRREAFERAQFLGRRIKDSCWQEMGPAGRLFVAWLGSVLGAIDPAPPPRDALYLHLLLDRYLLEANLVAEKAEQGEQGDEKGLSASLEARLAEVLAHEIEILQRVLVAVQADQEELARAAEAAVARPDERAGAAFQRFRRVAGGLLRLHSPGGYGLRITSSIGAPGPSMAALDQLVEAMVNRSTEALLPVLELAPPPAP